MMPGERPALFSRAFVLLMAANFTLSIGDAFSIQLSGFLATLGAGEAEVGRILALHALTAALLGPLAGWAMDRHGRRAVIRAGTVLALIAEAGYLAIDRVGPPLYALRVLGGAASTLLYATAFTYAAELVPPAARTQGIALFGASGLVTMAISSLIADRILAGGSYKVMFATALVFFALGGALCWLLPESPRESLREAEEPYAVSSGLWRTVCQRDLLPIWAAALTFFSCMAGVFSFMKTFVLATGYGSVGAFFSAYVAVALSLRVFFGTLPDRIGLRRMVLPAVSAYAIGLFGLANASGNASLLLAGALCGVGHGYGFPVLLSLVVSRAHPAMRGTATGIYSTIDWLGNLLAPPLIGLLIERAGYGMGFSALGAIGLLGVAAFYALDRGIPGCNVARDQPRG